MPSGVRDIQHLELKDTISQLNNTISTQNELIRSLQKMLQERDAKDSEKDQLIANLQAQLDCPGFDDQVSPQVLQHPV